MAIYGIDPYGAPTLYGVPAQVQFDVSPFTSTSVSYSNVRLAWTNPRGTWTGFRLVKNWNGYPTREDDGIVLFDGTSSPNGWSDPDVQAGRFAYYAAWVNTASGWVRAGITSCLMVADHGSRDWVWSRTPNYFKYDAPDLSAVAMSQENEDLRTWMSIFAWGWDNLRTNADTLRHLNNPRRINQRNLELLAAQLGIVTGSGMDASRLRQFVRYAATIYRQKGTAAGLATWIRTLTGWDVDVQTSKNLLLNDDQSTMAHPSYPDWDASLNYATGEIVHYSKRWYQAGASGAYITPPTGLSTNNASWTWINDWQGSNVGLNSLTGGQYSWEVFSPTIPTASSTVLLGVGVQNSQDSTVLASNSLVVYNKSGAAGDMLARSVSRLTGQTTMDPGQVIADGVPVPWPTQTWVATTEYKPNDIIAYGGRAYQAQVASKGVVPPIPYDPPTSEWACVGRDGRVQLLVSAYAHVGWTRTTGVPVAIYPFVEWYDANGVLIGARMEARTAGNMCYDTFDPAAGNTMATHKTDIGTYTWSSPIGGGAWIIDGVLGGTIRPPNPGLRGIALITGDADCQLAVTLRTAPTTVSSFNQGLIFRFTDTTNYWRATRTSLQKIAASVVTTPITWATLADGDRLGVRMSGNVYTVYKNGAQIGTFTDATNFNLTATQHGMVME